LCLFGCVGHLPKMEQKTTATIARNAKKCSSLSSSRTAVDEEPRARVKKMLGSKGIKLWKPPYYGVREWKQELQHLAHQFIHEENDTPTNTASSSSSSSSSSLSEVVIYENLEHFRAHALGKLRTRGKQLLELHIQVLGGATGIGTILKNKKVEDDKEHTINWAEEVSIVASTNKNVVIILRHVNPELTVQEFEQQLSSYFSSGAGGGGGATEGNRKDDNNRDFDFLASLVHKALRKECSNEEEKQAVNLSARLLGENKNSSGKAKVLCMVRRHRRTCEQSQHDPDQVLIDSIRTAANKLQNEMLDITDGNGNFVPMTNADRRAFLMALGLHAVGKERIIYQNGNNENSNEKNGNETNGTDNNDNSNSNTLIFLLQADDEWNSLDNSWRTRVDNYGLLQLDICWMYLRSQCLEYLSDVIQRLERAERVLRSQVDVNFVTLSMVQAELGNPVPAAAAVFVRLFLLQGVAYRYYKVSGNAAMLGVYQKKSKERLEWAWALAKSLRDASPPEIVQQLIVKIDGGSATTTTNFQAISALRRTNGNMNRAAETIRSDGQQIEQAQEDRLQQNKLGLCQNGKQYVDLQLLKQLQISLDLPSSIDDDNHGDDPGHRNNQNEEIDETITMISGLVRLSNNDLGVAIDMYQEYLHQPTIILQRLAELDTSQGRRSRKRKQARVDEMDLMSLMSMTGVSIETAKRALLSTSSNVDQALLWLSIDSNRHSETSNSESTENSVVEKVDAGGIENLTDEQKLSSSSPGSGVRTPTEGVVPGVDTPTEGGDKRSPMPSLDTHDAVELAREQAEQEAIQSLKGLLGGALEKQDRTGDGYLGISLDEEWDYIVQFRTMK